MNTLASHNITSEPSNVSNDGRSFSPSSSSESQPSYDKAPRSILSSDIKVDLKNDETVRYYSSYLLSQSLDNALGQKAPSHETFGGKTSLDNEFLFKEHINQRPSSQQNVVTRSNHEDAAITSDIPINVVEADDDIPKLHIPVSPNRNLEDSPNHKSLTLASENASTKDSTIQNIPMLKLDEGNETPKNNQLSVLSNSSSMLFRRKSLDPVSSRLSTSDISTNRRKSLSPLDNNSIINNILPVPNLERRASLQILGRSEKKDKKMRSQTSLSTEASGVTSRKSAVGSLIEKFSSMAASISPKHEKDYAIALISPPGSTSGFFRSKVPSSQNIDVSKTKHSSPPSAVPIKETKSMSKSSAAIVGRRQSESPTKENGSFQSEAVLVKREESSNSINDSEYINDQKKKGLHRTHAMSKKRQGSTRKMNESLSQATLSSAEGRSFSGFNWTPTEKLKYMYKCFNNAKSSCDHLCEVIGSLSDKKFTDEQEKVELFSLTAKDLANSCCEFIALMPDSSYSSLLRKCSSQFDQISKFSTGSMNLKDKDYEYSYLNRKSFRLCQCFLIIIACGISDFAKNNALIPIKVVQGWKLELVGLESLKTWQLISSNGSEESGDASAEKLIDDFTLDFDDSEDAIQSLSLKAKKERLSKMEKDKPDRNEHLNWIKPQYFVSKKSKLQYRKAEEFKKSLFSTAGILKTNAEGHVIASIDYFDMEALVYRKLFFGKDHRNYIGQNEKFGEFAISIRRELNEKLSSAGYQYRILFRSKTVGSLVHLIIPEADVVGTNKISLFSSKDQGSPNPLEPNEKAYKNAILCIHPKLDINKMKRHDSTEFPQMSIDTFMKLATKLEKSLMQLDEHKTAFNYKFGLMYIKDGQNNETQWFDNTETSDSFKQFCDVLGQTITLKDHQGFTGGLDTKNGNTGEKSVYTSFSYDPVNSVCMNATNTTDNGMLNFEIMYHCSPLLPYTPGDEQQIQRKRHIGNDLITIVFIDKDNNSIKESDSGFLSKTLFDPRRIKSQFLHVYFVVQEVMWDLNNFPGQARNSTETGSIPSYIVYCTSTLDVPNFGPSLSDPSVYPISNSEEKRNFREFFLAKLINAENAAFEASKFRTLHSRTYNGLMESLIKEFYLDAQSSNPRQSFKSATLTSDKRKPSRGHDNNATISEESPKKEHRSASLAPDIFNDAKVTITAMLVRRMNSTAKPRTPRTYESYSNESSIERIFEKEKTNSSGSIQRKSERAHKVRSSEVDPEKINEFTEISNRERPSSAKVKSKNDNQVEILHEKNLTKSRSKSSIEKKDESLGAFFRERFPSKQLTEKPLTSIFNKNKDERKASSLRGGSEEEAEKPFTVVSSSDEVEIAVYDVNLINAESSKFGSNTSISDKELLAILSQDPNVTNVALMANGAKNDMSFESPRNIPRRIKDRMETNKVKENTNQNDTTSLDIAKVDCKP